MTFERSHRGFTISTDPGRLDLDVIHRYLSEESYWARGRNREVVERSVATSLNFGVYDGERQIGGARVVTDGVTFGWLCDLFVLPDHRGLGVGTALIRAVVEHPDVADLKRLVLATEDAHELYRDVGGFADLADPHRWMIRTGPTA